MVVQGEYQTHIDVFHEKQLDLTLIWRLIKI